MIKIEIGCIVDWIDLNCRFRGLIIDIHHGVAAIVVVGSTQVHMQAVERLVPLRASRDFLDFCNPK